MGKRKLGPSEVPTHSAFWEAGSVPTTKARLETAMGKDSPRLRSSPRCTDRPRRRALAKGTITSCFEGLDKPNKAQPSGPPQHKQIKIPPFQKIAPIKHSQGHKGIYSETILVFFFFLQFLLCSCPVLTLESIPRNDPYPFERSLPKKKGDQRQESTKTYYSHSPNLEMTNHKGILTKTQSSTCSEHKPVKTKKTHKTHAGSGTKTQTDDTQ